MKILFFGKENDPFAIKALEILNKHFEIDSYLGKRTDVFPEKSYSWNGEYIFSYLSPWIIPSAVLAKAKKSGINWHPGPPEYPGIGCTNFAIYHGEKNFGITCHHMNPKVDTGNIIEVRRISVDNDESVYSLTQKCYEKIFQSFVHIIEIIKMNQSLPSSNEHWTRLPFKRTELDALCEISADMSDEEVKRRIRATTYDRPWAFTKIHGFRFELKL